MKKYNVNIDVVMYGEDELEIDAQLEAILSYSNPEYNIIKTEVIDEEV